MGRVGVLIEKGSAAVSCDANRSRQYVEQLNMNFIKVVIMKHSKRNTKNEPITMTNMLTYSDNSLKFQYDCIIHLIIH